MKSFCPLFSSSDPKAPGELIGWSWSVVCQHFQKDFFCEAPGPFVIILRVWLPETLGTKVCSNGPGHMTKVVAMPIYGKNPFKSFSRIKGPMALGLGMQHWRLRPYQVCSTDGTGMTLTYFMARSLWFHSLLYEKMLKQCIS